MTEEMSSTSEIRVWAETLRDRVLECASDQEIETPEARLPSTLQGDLLEAVDLLLDQVQREESEPRDSDISASLSTADGGLIDALTEVMDHNLAQWQASISKSYRQSTAGELAQQLKAVGRLRDDLAEEQARFQAEWAQVEHGKAELLKQQIKLKRQRSVLAKELRARKAELLLEAEQQARKIRDEADLAGQEERLRCQERMAELDSMCATQEEELELLRAELETLRSETADPGSEASHSEQEWSELLELANQDSARLQAELESLRAELDEASQSIPHDQDEDSQKREEQTQQELDERARLIEELERENDSLRERIANRDDAVIDRADSNQADADDVAGDGQQVAALQSQVAELTEALEAKSQLLALQVDDSEPAEWTELLEKAKLEIDDLRNQNADLATQVARQQVVESGSSPDAQFDQESLSWEERKQLIIRQLESDEDGGTGQTDSTTRFEIEQIIETTNAEVARRDREIDELRSIIEQQADTKQGVAIGAAAIAQMLDSDELIRQERQKLKEIQSEWEDKLRQAEIDLSMERAKLARERTQLESERNDAKLALPLVKPESSEAPRTRKWLEHLGLRDEKND